MRTERSPAKDVRSALHPAPANAGHEMRVVQAFVRKLQKHQGHTPCFRTDARHGCRKIDCRWRTDCLGRDAAVTL